MTNRPTAELNKLKAWPFIEAKSLLKRLNNETPKKGFVAFETGYGPSGLPHIGTFGEVARTSMVKRAFEYLSDMPTRLICFSDDMDGLRKVPQNVPNRELLGEDLGLPLTQVRDPFGQFKSFGHHNNNRLKGFLDQFGFDYEFLSATECYQSGKFDEMLMMALERYDQILEVILPSLGGITKGREKNYSPFLPISPKSGRVLEALLIERNPSKGTIVYQEPDGEKIEIPVTGGHTKLQWKPDWAMRWANFDIDYEMYGKDLIPSAELARKLCRVFEKKPPTEMFYELFLDENGQKISKSKGGSGISIEEWLNYSSQDSLSLFMYQKPKTAKKLGHEAIPRTTDELQKHISDYARQNQLEQLNNPVWHVYEGNIPSKGAGSVAYSMILNLVGASGTLDEKVVRGFVAKYSLNTKIKDNQDTNQMITGAINYFKEHVEPSRSFRPANPKERRALLELQMELENWVDETHPEELQRLVYSIGKKHEFDPLRAWFQGLYETLFGTSQGPRFGSFIALFGAKETARLIEQRLSENIEFH